MRFMLLMIPKGYERARPGTMPGNEIIEIRQVQEMEEFPEEVQKAAAGFSELQSQAGYKKAA